MSSPRKDRDPKTMREATRLVHGGSLRSEFGETSEALFLTQGYLYDTMELAEARFKGDDPGFIYSRYSNPTVSMFDWGEKVTAASRSVRVGSKGISHRVFLPMISRTRIVFRSRVGNPQHLLALRALAFLARVLKGNAHPFATVRTLEANLLGGSHLLHPPSPNDTARRPAR